MKPKAPNRHAQDVPTFFSTMMLAVGVTGVGLLLAVFMVFARFLF